MGTRKLAFLIIFFAFSASSSFNIMVSASVHEGVHEKSVKLSIAGSAGGGRGGTVRSGGRGVNGGKQSPTGGGSFIPVYVAGAGAAHGNQHHRSNATNCRFSSMLFVIIWATIMASICLGL
ncbi:hypothetical protein MRB53_018241 [Persea americana]|uniref:Uncharacterized protein n=1 Tax=Persea americana TaxID=3435 RepID=A0ACC2M6W6_PERAE|nr:hypothetical protein MRB53_018241 [Persea americana]